MDIILEDLSQASARLYEEKKFKEVEEMYSTFLKEASQESEELRAKAFNNRGHARYMQVDFNGAMSDYDEALKLQSDLTIAYYNRGTIKYRMGEFQEALKDFQVTIDNCPSNEEYKEGFEKCKKRCDTS